MGSRHSITIDQRRALRRWVHHQHPKPTQKQSIEWFLREYHHKLIFEFVGYLLIVQVVSNLSTKGSFRIAKRITDGTGFSTSLILSNQIWTHNLRWIYTWLFAGFYEAGIMTSQIQQFTTASRNLLLCRHQFRSQLQLSRLELQTYIGGSQKWETFTMQWLFQIF